jgi:hypothetical protein
VSDILLNIHLLLKRRRMLVSCCVGRIIVPTGDEVSGVLTGGGQSHSHAAAVTV